MYFQVPGDPHPWPRDASTASSACAVIVVDMQEDYCSPGYYMEQAGYDTQRLREPAWAIESVKIENGVFGTVANAEAFIDAFPDEVG